MAARKKPRYGNRCYAPKKDDGYPCQRGIKPRDTHCFDHPKWLPRIRNPADAPVYVPGHNDHLLRARPSSLSRFERDLRAGCVHCLDDLDGSWLNEVSSRGSRMVGPKLWRKALSPRAMRRCGSIADLAESSMDDEISGVMFRVFLQTIFPCAGFEETLVTELVTGFEGVESAAPHVGAARAMQLIGVQACLRHQSVPNPSECQSARSVLKRDGEYTFVKLLERGAGDWTRLAELAPT